MKKGVFLATSFALFSAGSIWLILSLLSLSSVQKKTFAIELTECSGRVPLCWFETQACWNISLSLYWENNKRHSQWADSNRPCRVNGLQWGTSSPSQTMMLLSTPLSEDKSLTATEVGQILRLEHGDRPPPPATQRVPDFSKHTCCFVRISDRCLSAALSVVDGVVFKCPADTWFSPTRTLDADY